jgi:hypothetical protein
MQAVEFGTAWIHAECTLNDHVPIGSMDMARMAESALIVEGDDEANVVTNSQASALSFETTPSSNNSSPDSLDPTPLVTTRG